MSSATTPPEHEHRKLTATQFLLRGLAISLPSVLTVVIVIWVAGLVYDYIIQPTSTVVRYTIAQFIDESRPADQFVPWNRLPSLPDVGTNYRIAPDFREELQATYPSEAGTSIPVDAVRGRAWVPLGRRAVPYTDYVEVSDRVGVAETPNSATGIYMELVTTRWFQSLFHLSAVAVIIVVCALYFLGRFVTVRLGAWIVHTIENRILGRLPLISNVYGSVKQVTDFFLSERSVEYNSVVAIEYPRRGIWSLGFVTGDSLLEMTTAAGEPLVTVLVPTSPMPVTGYTMSVPRSEVIDLNMTIDQAFQFCLSCGVLVPPQQRVTEDMLRAELAKRLVGGRGRRPSPNSHPGREPSADSVADTPAGEFGNSSSDAANSKQTPSDSSHPEEKQ